jgi:hypothetical protein
MTSQASIREVLLFPAMKPNEIENMPTHAVVNLRPAPGTNLSNNGVPRLFTF